MSCRPAGASDTGGFLRPRRGPTRGVRGDVARRMGARPAAADGTPLNPAPPLRTMSTSSPRDATTRPPRPRAKETAPRMNDTLRPDPYALTPDAVKEPPRTFF